MQYRQVVEVAFVQYIGRLWRLLQCSIGRWWLFFGAGNWVGQWVGNNYIHSFQMDNWRLHVLYAMLIVLHELPY